MMQGQFVLVHLAVDVGQGQVDLLVARLKGKQIFQTRNGLNVLSIARKDLGFSQLQPQTLGVQADGVVMNLLSLSQRTPFEVVLDEHLQVVVVKKLGIPSSHHGFKSLDEREHLLFFLMWASFVLHARSKYAANVGRKVEAVADFEQVSWKNAQRGLPRHGYLASM